MIDMKVAIIGATGYGGVELVRLLHQHQKVTTIDTFTSSEVGVPYSDKYPQFKGLYDEPMKAIDYDVLETYDVVFTSTPAGVTTTLLEPLIGKSVKLIDLAGDYRIQNTELYEQWYEKEAPKKELVAQAVYGLTEWNRQAIREAQLLSNPGCYPTATALSILPLIHDQLIDPNTCIIDAKSGVTGSGNKLSKSSHFCEANESTSIYKINKHQHIPEIEQSIEMFGKAQATITFSTHLVPMERGILTTAYAQLNEGVTAEMIHRSFAKHYENDPFVRYIKETTSFSTNQVRGSNFCDIHCNVDERTGRVTILAVIDNMVKGAAGQAIQNMNVMFGFDETLGIEFLPLPM